MPRDVTHFLLSAQSADAKVQTEAEGNLRQFQEQNLPSFLLALSLELSNNDKPLESRRLAGIVLKNLLDAKDAARKEQLVQQWVAIDISVKLEIKEMLLSTLGSSATEASQTSAQVIAKIASIEIPRKEWPELIRLLLFNMTEDYRPASLLQASLEALGYVCEEISHQDLMQDEVNSVLTAVVQGMNSTEYSPEVRLAATKALYNVLDFAQTNFENEKECNYIMKVVCVTTVAKEPEIRQAAFKCLVSIASTYYKVLEPYMQTIFELTSKAVKEDEEVVALQAIEFWSSICDEEIELQEFEDVKVGDSGTSHSHFIEKALPSLVPMLLETLLKQKEDQDQDDTTSNVSMAGGTCLGLVARTVGDAIVPLVMPFVQANISKADWRSCEAATYAFGSILEGPGVEKLAPMVHAGLEFLLNAMKDENNHVKDTTAWTLSRIFELLLSPSNGFSVIAPSNLQQVFGVLLESMKDAPHVAEKVCGAIYYLAQGYEDAVGPNLSVLTPYVPDIITCLIATADSSNGSDSKLRASAYKTLNEVVRCSNLKETSHIITQLLLVIMDKLAQIVELKIVSTDERERQGDLQALLCGLLQVIIQKLSSVEETKAVVLKAADQIMALFLKVFACRSSTVHEEAMLAIGALAYATGPEFEKYMSNFYKYLEIVLQNFEEYQVCAISVGVVGDIFRALDVNILPYCDGIMTLLLKHLSSGELHRSVKPPIFCCFGDVALLIEEDFEKYLMHAMQMMKGAAEICAGMDNSDEEMVEYGNQLRHSILKAYSGILRGFTDSKPDLMVPHAADLFRFLELVCVDSQRDESVTKAAVVVLGDLVDALGQNVKSLFADSVFCTEFLGECLQSDDEKLKKTARWTQGMIGSIFAANGEVSKYHDESIENWFAFYVAECDNYISGAFRSSFKNQVYLFMDNKFVLVDYTPGNDEILKGPLFTRHGFPTLADTDFDEYGIDCAFACHHGNQAYIFSSNYCALIQYTPGTTENQVIKGPMRIDDMFSFLEGTVFGECINAAFESSTTDEAYLFCGDQYAHINYGCNNPNLITSGKINQGFPGLEDTMFENGIEAAFASHCCNEAYIFKGDSCALINFAPAATNDCIIGGVNKIISNWPSLANILPDKNYGLDDIPSSPEVVTERKPVKDKPSADSGRKSRGSTKRSSDGLVKSNPKLADENYEEDENEHSKTLCGSCGGNYNAGEFSMRNRFKRLAWRVIADFLSVEEVEDIKETFRKIDTDNDGIVSIEELKSGLQKFGSQLGESEVQMLIESVDTHGKGTLDCGEFIAVSLHLQRMANVEHLHKAFSYFDKDGNGYIEPDELLDALMEDGADDCTDVANDIFQEVDTNNDGLISYDEFAAMMKSEDGRIGERLLDITQEGDSTA